MYVLALNHHVKYISYCSTVKKVYEDCPGSSSKGRCLQWMSYRKEYTHKSIYLSSSYSLVHIFDRRDQEEYSTVAETGSVFLMKYQTTASGFLAAQWHHVIGSHQQKVGGGSDVCHLQWVVKSMHNSFTVSSYLAWRLNQTRFQGLRRCWNNSLKKAWIPAWSNLPLITCTGCDMSEKPSLIVLSHIFGLFI